MSLFSTSMAVSEMNLSPTWSILSSQYVIRILKHSF